MLRGKRNVMANLKRQHMLMRKKALGGMIQAAIIVRRDMDATPPLIPVDTGILRASWFVTTSMGAVTQGSGDQGVVAAASAKARSSASPMLVMGFSASYGVFVHEMNWKEGSRPGSGPKFFESALNRNRAAMSQVMANAIKR